jgi:hypothetical protein
MIWLITHALIIIALISQSISAQNNLTSIKLNTNGIQSLVAYDLAVDPLDSSLYIVYENPNPIDFLVAKHDLYGTLLWISSFQSQSSPRVYHGDNYHFHGGNVWLDSADSRDLFIVTYRTASGYESSGYTIWRISWLSGKAIASTFTAASNVFPAGLVGDHTGFLYFGLTNSGKCEMARISKDIGSASRSVISCYKGNECEMSVLTSDGVNLYGAGTISSAGILLFKQPLASFSTATPILAPLNIPGFAYGIELDVARRLIYVVGRANVPIEIGRVLWKFDFDLTLKQKLSDGSNQQWNAFYFAQLHPSGDVYVGGEDLDSGSPLVGILRLSNVGLSKPIDSAAGRTGLMAKFNPNNYALFIVGKSGNLPLLYKYEGNI